MFRNNRKSYINNPAPQKALPPVNETQNSDEVRSMIVDTLKLLSKCVDDLRDNISELKDSLKETKDKVTQLEFRQTQTERKLEDCEWASVETNAKPTASIPEPRKAQSIKANNERTEANTTTPNKSIMPGVGFSAVTPEYLKNLKKT